MASYIPRPQLLPWSAATWSERWAKQGRMANAPVPRTPFLLLKAPSSTLYEEKYGGDRNVFTVAMYCGRMNARGIRVGLVVDCTALDLEEFEPLPAAKATASSPSSSANKFDRRVRYFHNNSEWDDFDVEYHRLLPPASSDECNNEPLAPQILTEFYQTVSNFMQKSHANNGATKTCIALFDSRGGLGAAAYLAAAYMCTKLRAPVHAAIAALKEGTPAQPGDDSGRKWGLCDVRLVKDLQTRFRGKKEIRMEGGTPSWWWAVEEEDEEENGEVAEEADQKGKGGDTTKRKRPREETIIIPPCEASAKESTAKRARTDASATGDLDPILPKEMLEPAPKDSPKWNRALTVLAQMTTSPPASSPPNPAEMATLPLKPEISANNSDADLLQSIKGNPDKYKVTWLSTKGRRGLLLILAEAVYFIEQSATSCLSVSTVCNIKFPSPKDLAKSQHRTLLDVVLVKDTERGKSTHRFYALDILCIEGGMVWHKPFDHRWKYLHEGVLIPRKKDESQPTTNHAYAKEPIKIRAKEYFPMKKLGFVMKDVCVGVGHEAEGVRVVPVGEYGIGESKDSTKAVVWKRGCGVDDDQLKALLLAS